MEKHLYKNKKRTFDRSGVVEDRRNEKVVKKMQERTNKHRKRADVTVDHSDRSSLESADEKELERKLKELQKKLKEESSSDASGSSSSDDSSSSDSKSSDSSSSSSSAVTLHHRHHKSNSTHKNRRMVFATSPKGNILRDKLFSKSIHNDNVKHNNSKRHDKIGHHNITGHVQKVLHGHPYSRGQLDGSKSQERINKRDYSAERKGHPALKKVGLYRKEDTRMPVGHFQNRRLDYDRKDLRGRNTSPSDVRGRDIATPDRIRKRISSPARNERYRSDNRMDRRVDQRTMKQMDGGKRSRRDGTIERIDGARKNNAGKSEDWNFGGRIIENDYKILERTRSPERYRNFDKFPEKKLLNTDRNFKNHGINLDKLNNSNRKSNDAKRLVRSTDTLRKDNKIGGLSITVDRKSVERFMTSPEIISRNILDNSTPGPVIHDPSMHRRPRPFIPNRMDMLPPDMEKERPHNIEWNRNYIPHSSPIIPNRMPPPVMNRESPPPILIVNKMTIQGKKDDKVKTALNDDGLSDVSDEEINDENKSFSNYRTTNISERLKNFAQSKNQIQLKMLAMGKDCTPFIQDRDLSPPKEEKDTTDCNLLQEISKEDIEDDDDDIDDETVSVVSDTLGVDWESIVNEWKECQLVKNSKSNVTEKWKPRNILELIGISKKYCNRNINEILIEDNAVTDDCFLSSIACVHCHLKKRNKKRLKMMEPFKGALSFSRDIELRRELCNVGVKSSNSHDTAPLCS